MSDRNRRLFVSIGLLVALVSWEAIAGPAADPTRPPSLPIDPSRVEANQAEAPLELQAVFYAEGRRVAIINGQRLHQDETVQSARVVRIERDRVAVRRNGDTIELLLVDKDVKRPSPASRITGDDSSSPSLSDLPAAIAAPEEGSHP